MIGFCFDQDIIKMHSKTTEFYLWYANTHCDCPQQNQGITTTESILIDKVDVELVNRIGLAFGFRASFVQERICNAIDCHHAWFNAYSIRHRLNDVESCETN